MEQSLGFLFAAFFIAWLVLIVYVWSLAGRLSALRRELERLKGEDPAE
jgi:CcmD family protein